MRRRTRYLFVLTVACTVLELPASASAQPTAQLSGAIYDHTGGILPSVVITIAGPENRETRSNDEGRFEFSGLLPGEYAFEAELGGFAPLRRDVRVRPGEMANLSLTMAVALLEQTFVTAAKAGSGDVQTTPLAVSAVSNADLARLATRTLEQAAALMPSVTFTQNSSFAQLSIRGIGTNAVNAGADQSSALYLDGVYLARPAMAFVDFLDLDRVEVLRGPQGTLYGRNAVGGAVNLISKAPTNEFQAFGQLTVGNFNEQRIEGRVSGALKRDRLMGSVAFARGSRDGYVRDLEHPSHTLGGDNLTAARAQLRAIVDRRTDLLVSADVTDQEGTLLTFNKVLQVKPGFMISNTADFQEVRTSTPASSVVSQSGVTARLTSALTPSTTLVSLSSYRRVRNNILADADITELPLVTVRVNERQHQWSEELTVSHRRPGLTWVAGTFLFHEADHGPIWIDQPQAGIQVQLDPRVTATSGAIFGQATVGLARLLSATAGLRFTRESKSIDNAGGRYNLTAQAFAPDSTYDYIDSITHNAWTPKFGVELTLPRNTLAYVSATRGFKSGGFNPSSMQPGRGFAPEWAWSYEGGFKTGLLDGRARLAVAAFDMEYTNLQVQAPVGIGVFDIRNAAAATIQGVEVEASARLGRGLDAGGHVTWLDATYDRYVAVAMGGVTGDVAGNRLNNAPEFAGRLWIQWAGDLGATKRLLLAADAAAQSTVFYTPFNDDIQRQLPYGQLGIRAEYGPAHRRWSLNAYVRNLTDTDYIMATFATSPAAYGGRPGASRQFGIQLALRR